MEIDTIASALTDHISADVPVTTAPEIAESTGLDRRRVNEGLRLLRRNDEAASKDVGARARVWWPTPHPWCRGDLNDARSGVIEEITHVWEPGRNAEEREERRRNGRKILQWLREQEHAATKQDFIDDLHPQYCDAGAGQDSWWRRQVRPLLETAAEDGLVEERGRTWVWTGDS